MILNFEGVSAAFYVWIDGYFVGYSQVILFLSLCLPICLCLSLVRVWIDGYFVGYSQIVLSLSL